MMKLIMKTETDIYICISLINTEQLTDTLCIYEIFQCNFL